MAAITRDLAAFVHDTGWADMPPEVRHAGTRSFLNFLGCAFGGAGEEAVVIAAGLADAVSGPRDTTAIGRLDRLDRLNATAVNCQSATAMAFDDTHLAAIVHPTCTVGAAALALAESRPVSGGDFLAAVIHGIELQCRLAVGLFVPPAEREFGWYMTGVVGGIGTAATAARLLGLDAAQTMHALAIAAVRGGGFRQALPNMCVGYVPAEAARAGLAAALLAQRGFTGSPEVFEGANGYGQVFARKANLAAAIDGFGTRWETLANTCKPYPCGLVSHPVIDACLAIARDHHVDPAAVTRVDVQVSPTAFTLGNRPAPTAAHDARVSIQYWAAVSLARRAAGLAEIAEPVVHDPLVAALRQRVALRADPALAEDAARVAVRLADGAVVDRHVEHCTGSLQNPMSDLQLDAKFLEQVAPVLGEARARRLVALCRRLPDLADAGEIARQARVGD